MNSARLTFFSPSLLSETTDHGSSKCDKWVDFLLRRSPDRVVCIYERILTLSALLCRVFISGIGGPGATQKEKVKGKDETYWKEINAAMALTNLAQGKDSASGTTSCIIQKSSHIAEIKTVKVPLVQKY